MGCFYRSKDEQERLYNGDFLFILFIHSFANFIWFSNLAEILNN